MTCIIAIRNKNNKIIIAADRRETEVITLQPLIVAEPKVKKAKNGMIFAGAGDSYLCALIVDYLTLSLPHQKKIPDTIYMHEIIHKKISTILKEKNFIEYGHVSIPKDYSAEILCTLNSTLWHIDISTDDEKTGIIKILPAKTPYYIGTGDVFARACIDILSRDDVYLKANDKFKRATDKDKIKIAMEVSSKNNLSVSNDFDVEIED